MSATLRLALAASLVISLAACGEEEGPKPQKSIPAATAPAEPAAPGAPPPAGGAPAAAGAPAAPAPPAPPQPAVIRGGSGVMIYSKVSEDYRKKLDQADFTADANGDMNRDPFHSYLFGQVTTAAPSSEVRENRCKKRTVAPSAGLQELKLVGVVLRGTRGYAMFIDSQGRGHTVNRGDCLAKEQAGVKAIGQDRVTIEIRPEVTGGEVAPPAREEVIRLHVDELDVTEDMLGTGAE